MAVALYSTAARATIPDGTYTSSSVSGNFSANCTPSPGTGGIVSYSGASATLTVSGNSVTLDISSPGQFSISASGTQSGGLINLSASYQIFASTPQPTGLSDTASVPVVVSGSSVDIDFFQLTSPGGDCINGVIDVNPFTVTLTSGKVISSESPGTDATTEEITRIAPRVDAEVIHQRGNSRARNLNRNRGSGNNFTRTGSGVTYNLDSGLSAGDWPMSFGAWVNYSYNDFEDEFTATAFDGDRHGFLAGIDYKPTDNSVLGVAVGYEFSDLDTQFNQGEQETDGFTIAPYFGLLLTETLSLDFSLGYTNLETDQFRTAPGTTTRITSEVDGDRWYGAFNLNGLWFYDRWIIGARVGALYARTTQDDFVESDGTAVTETTGRIGQINIGGDVAYSLDEWEPFARLTYEYDFNQTETNVAGPVQPSFDDDDFLVGFGVRYFNNNGWAGNLEYNKRLGREDFDEDSISLTIQGEF